MESPSPRVALGMALRGIASSALPIMSDGLVGDLGHILQASGVGACIDTSIAINLIANRGHLTLENGQFDAEMALDCVLAGGDDYELVFTAPPSARSRVKAAALQSETSVTRIGVIEAAGGLRLVDATGQPVHRRFASFDHFAS
jgi:thiamine-monophosphate kinase